MQLKLLKNVSFHNTCYQTVLSPEQKKKNGFLLWRIKHFVHGIPHYISFNMQMHEIGGRQNNHSVYRIKRELRTHDVVASASAPSLFYIYKYTYIHMREYVFYDDRSALTSN